MKRAAFTLIEIVMAMAACALILAAIYGVFSRAIHLRNNALEHTRASRVRAHAAQVLRNDLRNAIISGGTLAATLTGSQDTHGGSFPGYLKFITTTARDTGDLLAVPDLQQVEYYIVNDAQAVNQRAGVLVRAVETNLLAPVQGAPVEETLLADIESMEVAFYDGQDWKSSWEVTTDDPTVPEAIRVRWQPATLPGEAKLPPIEVLAPWTSQPAIDATAATTDGTAQ